MGRVAHLDGDEVLGEAQGGGEEDGRDLANVGGDHVADEGLHVVVDGSPLLHCSHLRQDLQ